MRAYKKILVPSISACPSMAQLTRCSEIATTRGSEARVIQFIDSSSGFESDGPAGGFPDELAARKVPAARKRLELLLSRSRLGWAECCVTHGQPDSLLAGTLREWQPDLVIVSSGWGHTRWVERAARVAGIAIPDILGVKADGLLGRLLGGMLPNTMPRAHHSLHDAM